MKISRLKVFAFQPPVSYVCDYDCMDGYEIEQVGSVFCVRNKRINKCVAEISVSLPHVVEYCEFDNGK